jgi:hydroxyacylglutathione hydrolase
MVEIYTYFSIRDSSSFGLKDAALRRRNIILEQFYLNCLAHASYLVGDEEAHTAVIIDPQRDIQRYLESAEKHGLQIRHVFLSHLHADFIAGHLELRDRT